MERIAGMVWAEPFELPDIICLDEEIPEPIPKERRLALRLTNGQLAASTSRAFGQYFFTDLTAILTVPSLLRLVDMSSYPVLSKFPRKLYRLLSMDEVMLLPSSLSAPSQCISRTCSF